MCCDCETNDGHNVWYECAHIMAISQRKSQKGAAILESGLLYVLKWIFNTLIYKFFFFLSVAFHGLETLKYTWKKKSHTDWSEVKTKIKYESNGRQKELLAQEYRTLSRESER